MNKNDIDDLSVLLSSETSDVIQPNFADIKTVADEIEAVKTLAVNMIAAIAMKTNIDMAVLNMNDIKNASSSAQITIVKASEALTSRNEALEFRNQAQSIAGGNVSSDLVKFGDASSLTTFATSDDATLDNFQKIVTYIKNSTNRLNVIDTLLASDDLSLDEFQEIVNFIKQNKTDLQTLDLSNIAETANLKHFTNILKTKLDSLALNGNALEKFKVAAAMASDEAVSKEQMETAIENSKKILQVQSYEDRVDRSHSNNTPTDSGLLFSFTPTKANSELIFVLSIAFAAPDSSQYAGGRVLIGDIVRASTIQSSGSSYSNRNEDTYSKTIKHQCTSLVPVTMKVELFTNDNAVYMNRAASTGGAFTEDFVTTLTVFEVGV